MNNYNAIIGTLLRTGAKKATKYISPNFVIKATLYGKLDRRVRQQSVRVTVGTPNYSERIFIKDAVKAGEPFPIRKIHLRMPIKRT